MPPLRWIFLLVYVGMFGCCELRRIVSKVAIFCSWSFRLPFFFFIRFLSCQTDSEIVVLAVKMESLGFLFSFFIKKMLKDTKMKFKLINICFTLNYYIF